MLNTAAVPSVYVLGDLGEKKNLPVDIFLSFFFYYSQGARMFGASPCTIMMVTI
jgi:hypothetical protein